MRFALCSISLVILFSIFPYRSGKQVGIVSDSKCITDSENMREKNYNNLFTAGRSVKHMVAPIDFQVMLISRLVVRILLNVPKTSGLLAMQNKKYSIHSTDFDLEKIYLPIGEKSTAPKKY
jgi:hypothetical protein